MNFIFSYGGGGLLNGNPKVVYSRFHCSGTKISTKFGFLVLPIKTEIVIFGYRNLDTRSTRHSSSSEDVAHFFHGGRGGGGLVNGNPKVVSTQNHFSGTKISISFAF